MRGAGMTRAMSIVSACASSIILATITLTATGGQTERVRRIGSNDSGLRKLAITAPTPTYPPASLKKKVAGVVVAAIRADPKGATEAVEILQSPDAETGRAVHDAVMRWTFKPMGAYGLEGTVMFYFHRIGSRGAVLSPAEMREVINPGVKDVKGGTNRMPHASPMPSSVPCRPGRSR
jgi:TonB family protein